MSSKKIIAHCAPTLVGIKTANLFNEYYEDKDELLKEIKNFNNIFKSYGLNMIPITIGNGRALIYVYRINDLKNDFNNNIAKELLTEYGYNTNDIFMSLRRLSQKIEKHGDFPHEIGLFLGYPPEDVKGFIDNNAKNYKLSGYWKVYGDEKKAIELFRKYRKCQSVLQDSLNKGLSLKQLVIQK